MTDPLQALIGKWRYMAREGQTVCSNNPRFAFEMAAEHRVYLACADELDAALRSLPVETDVQALDASRWQMVEQALTDPALLTETSRLIAIGSIITSRKPYTEQDIARSHALAEQHGWEKP